MKKSILFLIILSASSLFADSVRHVYNLEYFMKCGFTESNRIKQEMLKNKNAEDMRRNALYNFLPDASLFGGSSFNYNDPSSRQYDNGLRGYGTHSNSAGISVSKSFSSADETIFGYLRSNYDMQRRNLDFETAKQELAYKILKDFTGVLKLQKSVEISTENLKLRKKINDETKILYETGRKSLLDLRQSKIYLLDAEINLADIKLSLKKSRENFFNFLMTEDNGSLFVEPEFPNDDYEFIYKENNWLAGLDIDGKKTELNLLQRKIELFPRLSFSLNWSKSASETYENNLLETERYGSSYGWNFRISYPVFSLLQNHTSYRIQKRNYRSFLLDRDKAKKDHKLKFKHLAEEYEILKETYKSALQKKKLAEENLKTATEKYNLGSVSLTDLDKSSIEALNSEYSVIAKFYDLILKREEIKLHISEK
ncbi:MAG: hypothetical protein CSB55_08425 [Candidatus Cloacimonadota bacterium]|nr:MAG: hypothetical protein CSB55_08425 [Candidatus Cloacimonadota bacterium]